MSSVEINQIEIHRRGLGSLLANLQSLEWCLRLHLHFAEDPSFLTKYEITDLAVGTILEVNSITNYDSLKDLIGKYNARLGKGEKALRVDENVVELRDAIAHGRIISRTVNSEFTLVKFSKPANSKVVMTYSQKMTKEWLSEKVRWTFELIQRVAQSMDNWRAAHLPRPPQNHDD